MVVGEGAAGAYGACGGCVSGGVEGGGVVCE